MSKTIDTTAGEPAVDWDTFTLDLSSVNNAALDTMVYSSASLVDTITLGAAGHTNTVWTTTGTGTGTWSMDDYTIGNGVKQSATISLKGEDADIDINGVSLMETLRGIQERLAILEPNPGLEAEWDELRALGEQYRALEQQIKDKMATWDRLKAMPPPEVD